MVAVGTMGVCFVWLHPPPPEYQPPTIISVQWVVTRSQGPGGLCGPQCPSVYNNRILSQPATISILIIVPTLCVITQD